MNLRSTERITVGSVCKSQLVTVLFEASAGEAVARVRESKQRGHIFYVYATDKQGRLVGIVSIRNLLLASENDAISSIASRDVVSLDASLAVEDAYLIFSQSRFLSLPVVDTSGKLIGVVQAHELIEEYGSELAQLFEERTRGELFDLLGIKAEHASRGILPTTFGRFPWLLINIVGGTLSAFFIHSYGDKLPNAVLYLAFVPILLILSESIGMQTASIVIANLHRSSRKTKVSGSHWREFLVATLLGLACGAVVGSAVYAWKGDSQLASVIWLTIFGGAMWVSALGNVIPRLFHHFQIDPRVAAGPVVLAIADFSTLLWYLGLAYWLTR